jgi:glycosyltransferase involved in cell wall biosynthesis
MGNWSSKKLALVTETWPPEINGVAMTLSRLADGLAERDWRVTLVRPRQAADSSVADTHQDHLLVPGLPIPGYSGLRFGLPVHDMLRRRWNASRPDVVHIATEGPLGWAAMRAARGLAIPVTSSFHTNFQRYCRHYRLGWLRGAITRHLRGFHNRSALTMAPCETLCSTLRQEGYRNVVALGRGVDIGQFDPARRSHLLRASWGVGPDDLVAIYVGRLAPEKNLRTVAVAFSAMEQLNPRLRMVWVGDGPQLGKLRRQYPHHVFTGAKIGEELAAHYASADIFLFPSLTETYGNVLPEAMASGLAVIAFDYAAAALYLRHGENGLLAPYGDTDEFIHQAERLACAPKRVRRLGLRARDTVASHSWDVVCGQFDRYLNIAAKGDASCLPD